MNASTPRWEFVGAAALLVAVLWPLAASAQQGDDPFKRGLDAKDKKNWKLAETEMKSAIARDPKESTRKVGAVLRLGGTEYLPYYFLGEALYNQNDCAGAVTQWEISQQQGVITTLREFSMSLERGISACATKGVLPPAEFKAQSAVATQEVKDAVAFVDRVSKTGNADAWRQDLREQYSRIGPDLAAAQTKLSVGMRSRSAADFADARAAAGRVVIALRSFETALKASIANLGEVQGLARDVDQSINESQAKDNAIEGLKASLTPELTTSHLKGRDALTRARNQLAAGKQTQNIGTVTEASSSAREAATILEQVLAEATRIARDVLQRELADALSAAREALSFLDSSLATVDKLFTEKAAAVTPDAQAQHEALQKRIAGIRRRVETAENAQNVKGLKDASRLAVEARTDLDKLVIAFGPLSLRDRGVHAALEDGARQFFAGEYQRALATLDPNALIDAPLQLHVHLFRAAALYHLFVRSAEKDQMLKQRALDEIAACKRLNSQFAPDSRAFAPRFVAFYQNAASATP